MTTERPLSEEEARQILAAKHSQAADPNYYSAQRANGAWVFIWSDQIRPVPMGVRSEIVVDSGQSGRFEIGETTEQAIERLSN